ncbi:UDP-glucose/GDP-mannose dehydrogenase family protein, partial [Pantoea sp. SIMBA_133]
VKFVQTIEEALMEADLVMIITEWKEIKEITPSTYKELMNTPIIFDGRNCYSTDEMEKHNLEYYSIGRPQVTKELVYE